ASASDTISVGAGTYVEDLDFLVGIDNLELIGAGVGSTTIKGVVNEPIASWPLAVPNIDVLADGVSIHDFTIQGPDPAVGYYASGMLVGGDGLEVYDNAFEVPNADSLDEISQAIVTYRDANNPTGGDVDGLNIHDNTFTDFGAGTAGFEAIFINHTLGDPTPGVATIADNVFSGDVLRAITTERSNVSITGNTILTDMVPSDLSSGFGGYQGINVRDYDGRDQQDVTITGNAVGGSGAGLGFHEGIRIGMDAAQVMSNVVTKGNTYPGDNTSNLVRFVPKITDFDGDGDTDVSVFRPSNGRWYIEGMGNFKWALTGDLPVPGDYDGDGTTDIAIYRPSNGKWYIMGELPASWGQSGDIPVQADYTGDRADDKAVLRTATKRWYIEGIGNMKWYFPGDIPVPCDYDGDGSAEIAVFRPSNNNWYVMGDSPVGWGQSGDIPVPADYDGDGACDIAVFRPSTGTWYVSGQGSTNWGSSGDIPVPGDYDGDGATEFAILRPSNGKWYIKDVGTFSWYHTGDYPLPVRDTNADGDPYE
ncbi:MAG: hypothetical protein WBB64_02725, partial [Anaerolineales bacterium]